MHLIPFEHIWHGLNRRVVVIAKAAHAFEHQFGVDIDCGQALAGLGPVTLIYWANGDDDGVHAVLSDSGSVYYYDEVQDCFHPTNQDLN